MQLRQLLKISVVTFACLLFVLFAAAMVYPLFSSVFAVQEVTPGQKEDSVPEDEPVQPEMAKLQTYYIMEEEKTEITRIYAELFNAAAKKVFYFEIPVTTSVTLPQELYQELGVYAPGLPQYLKLSKMAESFSKEYRMNGCQSILSEVLGVPASHWIALTETEWQEWKEAVFAEPKNEREFFEQYAALINGTESDETAEERWVYYESYAVGKAEWKGTVPGIEGVGTFEIQKVRTKELFERCLRETDMEKQ